MSQDINIDIKTTADLTSAVEVKEALINIEDQLRKIENEGNAEGMEERVEGIRDLIEETEAFAEISGEAWEESSPAAADFQKRVKVLTIETEKLKKETAKLKEETAGNTNELSDYVEAADEAAEAMGEAGERAKKMGQDIKEINFAQHIQLSAQFARGLRSLGTIARDSGNKELADHLSKASHQMDVLSGAASGALNLDKIIKEAGGARAALGRLTTFMTGPVGIALAAASLAWWGFKKAIDESNKSLDAILEKNSKSVVVVKTAAEIEKAARLATINTIEDQQWAIENLLASEKKELTLAQERRRIDIAKTNSSKAVALATIDAKRSAGTISEVEAIKDRAAIERGSQKALHDADSVKRKKDLDVLGRKLEHWRGLMEDSRNDLVEAQAQSKTRRFLFNDRDKKSLRTNDSRRGFLRKEISAANDTGFKTGIYKAELAKLTAAAERIIVRSSKRADDELRGGKGLEEMPQIIESLKKLFERNAAQFDRTSDALTEKTRSSSVDQQVQDINLGGTQEATAILQDSKIKLAEKDAADAAVLKEAKDIGSSLQEGLKAQGATADALEAARKKSSDIVRLTEESLKSGGEIDTEEQTKIQTALDQLRRDYATNSQATLQNISDLTMAVRHSITAQSQLKQHIDNVVQQQNSK